MGTDAIVDPRAGGRYDLVVNGLGISGHVEHLRPAEASGCHLGLHRQPQPPPGLSIVEILLTPDGPGANVELTHCGLDRGQGARSPGGLAALLERLRITAAGGGPGPDTPPDRPSDHEAS